MSGLKALICVVDQIKVVRSMHESLKTHDQSLAFLNNKVIFAPPSKERWDKKIQNIKHFL